ncbi:hypothetical protein BJX76DRAFT_219794 [Aspergillus varians]
MTTTIADQRAHHPETPKNYSLVQDHTISDACIISRLSKWLRSCRAGPLLATSAKPVPKQHLTEVEHEVRSSTSEQAPGLENAFPCRACQSWGVECDRKKPHCSHCLDQQILCFYVEPLRVTMKRSKQSKKLQPAHLDSDTS